MSENTIKESRKTKAAFGSRVVGTYLVGRCVQTMGMRAPLVLSSQREPRMRAGTRAALSSFSLIYA